MTENQTREPLRERKWYIPVFSLVFGVLLFVLSLATSYVSSGEGYFSNDNLNAWTGRLIRHYFFEIENLRLEGDMQLPESLSELPQMVSDMHMPSAPVNKSGQILDYWGNPILYEVDGTSFTITSYGRDSRPGGKYLDADIIYKEKIGLLPDDFAWDAWEEVRERRGYPSLWDFLFKLPTTDPIWLIAWLNGLSGTLLCGAVLWLTPKINFLRLKQSIIIGLSLIIIFSIIIARILSLLHIPSFH